jgi:hypothetical protein
VKAWRLLIAMQDAMAEAFDAAIKREVVETKSRTVLRDRPCSSSKSSNGSSARNTTS